MVGSNSYSLVWIDMEMSGLEPKKEVILEIASVVTDDKLNLIETGPEIVIHHDQAIFETMDDWNQKQHTKSGLWEKVLQSSVTTAEAEAETMKFLETHIAPQSAPLCGNSVHQDRRFISMHMLNLDAFLHYRIIDVSSFKEIAQRWYPQISHCAKKNDHRAMEDILESIEELKYYRKHLFK